MEKVEIDGGDECVDLQQAEVDVSVDGLCENSDRL